jgi:hypothetical protein
MGYEINKIMVIIAYLKSPLFIFRFFKELCKALFHALSHSNPNEPQIGEEGRKIKRQPDIQLQL